MPEDPVSRELVPITQRLTITARLFGTHFPLVLEPTIFSITGRLAKAYQGGYWDFFSLSNGGFYMAPDLHAGFSIVCDNGFEGSLSADALGITACLYSYSHLSFSGPPSLAATCADHYHWLRDYMLGHPEAKQILRAID